MPLTALAAILFTLLTGVIVIFHMLMAAGAPWGHLTMGGKYRGALPPRARILPLLSAGILCALAYVVLTRAGLTEAVLPPWSTWAALALTLATTAANLATPSKAERQLWGPVTVAMSLCILLVIFYP